MVSWLENKEISMRYNGFQNKIFVDRVLTGHRIDNQGFKQAVIVVPKKLWFAFRCLRWCAPTLQGAITYARILALFFTTLVTNGG